MMGGGDGGGSRHPEVRVGRPGAGCGVVGTCGRFGRRGLSTKGTDSSFGDGSEWGASSGGRACPHAFPPHAAPAAPPSPLFQIASSSSSTSRLATTAPDDADRPHGTSESDVGLYGLVGVVGLLGLPLMALGTVWRRFSLSRGLDPTLGYHEEMPPSPKTEPPADPPLSTDHPSPYSPPPTLRKPVSGDADC